MEPDVYGPAEECDFCKEIELSDIGGKMLEELKNNGASPLEMFVAIFQLLR